MSRTPIIDLVSVTVICLGVPSLSHAAGWDKVTYPVKFGKNADLKKMGISIAGYGKDASTVNQFATRCYYYYGDGGYDISISDAYLAGAKTRGFSRRSLCMALVSEAKFDPETGRRLPTYIIGNLAKLAKNGGKPSEADDDISGELPLDVPSCFAGGRPYSDCRMNYDLLTGKKYSLKKTENFKALGARIDERLAAPEVGSAFKYMEDDGDLTKGEIMVGAGQEKLVEDDLSAQSFYDYSAEFPRGFGYALNAEGAAH
jgi:hypothetical protein